jgi:hypothetical protein
MMPEQVEQVFGRADLARVCGLGSLTIVSCWYSRYGGSVFWMNPPPVPSSQVTVCWESGRFAFFLLVLMSHKIIYVRFRQTST